MHEETNGTCLISQPYTCTALPLAYTFEDKRLGLVRSIREPVQLQELAIDLYISPEPEIIVLFFILMYDSV